MVDIKLITEDKQKYIDILLIADPCRQAICKYLEDSDLFVMLHDGKPVCAAAVLRVSQDTCELKNIAASVLRKGYGSKMLEFLFDYYKDMYKYMKVGTGNSSFGNIKFYEQNGFEITRTIENFFVDNYDNPIFEDGVQCKHMVMLKKSL